MGKRIMNTQQTKENLIQAFWQLFCEKRMEKITVKDITIKAGYNRSTFYEYFKDPYDVLECLENELIPNLNQLPPINAGIEGIGMPLDLFLQVYEKNEDYYTVLLGEDGDPAFSRKLKTALKPLLVQVLSTHSTLSFVKLDFVLEYTLTSMIAMLAYWYQHKAQLSQEELYHLLNRLMNEGVLKTVIENE